VLIFQREKRKRRGLHFLRVKTANLADKKKKDRIFSRKKEIFYLLGCFLMFVLRRGKGGGGFERH